MIRKRRSSTRKPSLKVFNLEKLPSGLGRIRRGHFLDDLAAIQSLQGEFGFDVKALVVTGICRADSRVKTR